MAVLRSLTAMVVAGALGGCIAPPQSGASAITSSVTPAAASGSFTVTAASFGCIRDLKPVRGFYVGNLLGDIDGTLAAANAADGATYPPGSVVQLVPGEAMVKHPRGFSTATNDWEFFELDVKPGQPTRIRVRGTTDVVNQFGGNCLDCHKQADPKWDMVCERTHGCLPIPITPVMSRAIQNTDPRCPAIPLPDDQQAALRQLAAFLSAARPSQPGQ